jgi:hypothetical protein
MPVRWKSKGGRKGRIASTLADWTSAVAGTSVAATPVSGRISALVLDWTASIAGQFQAIVYRTGAIASTLDSWTGAIYGNEDSPTVWTDSLGNSFNLTTGEVFSYTFQATDEDGDAIDFLVGTLPAWITPTEGTQSGNVRTITLSGTAPSTATTAAFTIDFDAAEADWLERSSGAVLATRLEDSTAITAYGFVESTSPPRLPALDTTIKPTGAAGSAKILVLAADSLANGAMRIPFGTTFGNGTTFWVSYREYCPPEWAFHPWSTSADSDYGNKHSIISIFANSNTAHEIVFAQTGQTGNYSGYYKDGGVSSGIWEQEQIATSVNSTDFRQCSGLDRSTAGSSGAFTTYPLTGTDPDTGLAWSLWQQERARYGSLYSARQQVQATDYVRGLGDPISGGFRPYPNEWVTITQRVTVGTFDTYSSRWTAWAARDGQAYVQLWDKPGIRFGGADGPYSALWLTPYVTGRSASSGRKVSTRTSNITGVTIHAVGLTTPVGAGSLEYNATTQRFRWAGLGQSFGTARGFSAVNGKLWLNVISTGNSYLLIKVDPAALPASGTTTDTVTIASPRADTFINYADVIVSTSAINAPGGYAPV